MDNIIIVYPMNKLVCKGITFNSNYELYYSLWLDKWTHLDTTVYGVIVISKLFDNALKRLRSITIYL